MGAASLAFFGGWLRRSIVFDDPTFWGDHRNRHIHAHATSGSGATLLQFLPPGALAPDGVSYTVWNTTGQALLVWDPDTVSQVEAVFDNEAAEFVHGPTGWWLVRRAAASFGTALPGRVLDIVITQNASQVNILQRAIAEHGYDGSYAALANVRVTSGVAVGAHTTGGRALTTGNTVDGVSWLAGSRMVLTVEAGAEIGGPGGPGGRGELYNVVGLPINGADGGQAVRCEIATIVINHGDIYGGGGGGGGGGASSAGGSLEIGGGGGGGRGLNMLANGIVTSAAGGSSATGSAGKSSLEGGGGGQGASGGGNGGAGGDRATNGSNGQTSTLSSAGGSGGAPGAALSYLPAAGAPTISSDSTGLINGSTVSEAS